ncbi:hypothetical protein L9F63_005105, partial [Diploptera punctata]
TLLDPQQMTIFFILLAETQNHQPNFCLFYPPAQTLDFCSNFSSSFLLCIFIKFTASNLASKSQRSTKSQSFVIIIYMLIH